MLMWSSTRTHGSHKWSSGKKWSVIPAAELPCRSVPSPDSCPGTNSTRACVRSELATGPRPRPRGCACGGSARHPLTRLPQSSPWNPGPHAAGLPNPHAPTLAKAYPNDQICDRRDCYILIRVRDAMTTIRRNNQGNTTAEELRDLNNRVKERGLNARGVVIVAETCAMARCDGAESEWPGTKAKRRPSTRREAPP